MLMGRKLLTIRRKIILIVLVKRMGMRDHISVGHHMDVAVGCGIEEEPAYGRKH